MGSDKRTEFVNCNLCDQDKGKVLYQFDREQILSKSRIELDLSSIDVLPSIIECQNCGLVYVNPRRVFSEGIMPYSYEAEEAYFLETRELRKVGFDYLIKKIQKTYNLSDIYVIDVGCGDGLFLNQCQQVGINCDGFEVSENLVAKLQSQYGSKKILTGSLDLITEAKYDIAFLTNVIEHLHDPSKVLAQIFQILKPGGLVFIHTPNNGGLPAKLFGSRWHQIDPLNHLYYFNQHTLEMVLRKTGFNPRRNFYLKSNSSLKSKVQFVLNFLNIKLDNGLGIIAERPLN